MINDPNGQHSIAWTELGTSFVVSNVGEFSRSILYSYFNHNKSFSSFVRQLNMYGFHHIKSAPRAPRTSTTSQTWEFSHPKFLRARPDLLDAIKRKALELNPRERVTRMTTRTSTSTSNTAVTADPTSQESPVSASDPLRDLTNELRGRPPYPITCGGFGDIWKCILGETVQVAVKTIRAFESDNKALVRKKHEESAS
ncbi:HSF-type DNA-binding-domain-containing protein [Suillus paluster]|uniref:HSF-type DNA-binding-domain-containing protein n=1 Tax=Suillus paluster TaxID=48578 RepID=UPI001B86778E|nr:HSF-type DNA-binding-domain-containing protein [Suillus paluster]KAG1748005.1 HSF-type DNA-binding-domain-containing protein [Suillus paluster]